MTSYNEQTKRDQAEQVSSSCRCTVVLGCGNKILVGINPFGPVSGLAGQLIPRVACDQMTASQGKLCWTEIPHSLALEPMW
jgi:hypothetical protein